MGKIIPIFPVARQRVPPSPDAQAHDKLLNAMLKTKVNLAAEIEIHFFEFCNLNCAFCGQDHDSIVGMDTVLSKVDKVTQFISTNNSSEFIVNMMGGELFNDLVGDSLFEDYFMFASLVNEQALLANKRVTFNWVTNLVFDNTSRVIKLLTDLKHQDIVTNISTSYDFAGRNLNEAKRTTFHKNLELFGDQIYTIGFVLTKQAIKRILQDSDEEFRYLYSTYPLYFDYYVPEKLSQHMIPSDREHLDVFLFLAEHYPKISPVNDWVNHKFNKMTCYSLNKLTLRPDGGEVKCRYLSYDPVDFQTEINYQSNANIIQSHLDKHGCLSCEHFDRCGFRCFVQADWTNRERTEVCLYKTFFNELLDPTNAQRYKAAI